MVVGQDGVLGFSDLSRERDELVERCEPIEGKNYDVKNKFFNLSVNADAISSLLKEVDRYIRPSIFVAQIEKLKVSLAHREKHCKKISEDADEVCWKFTMDQKYLK